MINDDLMPIPMIINQAKAVGVRFGYGDPKVHLAYLTKLRLLPQATRRKVNGAVVGCYPWETIQRLKQIEELKAVGWTYGEIRRELERPQEVRLNPPALNQYSSGLVFLVIGLFLGYLAAVTNSKMAAGSLAVGTAQANAPVVSEADSQMLKLVRARSSANDGPIYVIALPGGNFEHLGKTQINLAN